MRLVWWWLLVKVEDIALLPRRCWYSWRRAAHVVRMTATGREDARPFYGSMILAEERALYWPAPARWRAQYEADLAPEALDGSGGKPSQETHLMTAPVQPRSGPGEVVPPAPGPDPIPPGYWVADLTSGAYCPWPGADDWLDRQLAVHVEWVARMASLVTGWELAA